MVRFCLLTLLVFLSPAWSADQETETAHFLSETFSQPPATETLWLTNEVQSAIHNVLEHDYPAARLRYWRDGQRTAWVLEEIGKEMPITTGISVNNGAVERVSILAYRESRGWEVKSPAFTAQFNGAKLTPQLTLDHNIDGISGATLSVRALTRLARLAILLHNTVMNGHAP